MSRAAVVPIVPGIWRVPLVGDWVNGVIVRDDTGQVTLLDTGLRRSAPRILAALAAIGSTPHDVTRILLTHAHPDHAGGAARLASATGRGVSIHADDADYVRTGRPTPRDPTIRLGRLVRLVVRGTEPVAVEATLADGQLLDGGLRVIHTPGHSPGHAAFLHESTGVLLTGDSIFNVRGVRWPVAAFCSDFAMTQRTARRLVETDYETAVFTHGPELRERPRAHIRAFLAREGMLS